MGDDQLTTEPAALIEQIQAAGLHLPETMTVMVTDACNLRCRHCWLDCGTGIPRPVSGILTIIETFVRLGGTQLNLTGGEFLLHPDWPRILSHSLNQDRIRGVCLQTNATLIRKDHVDVLLKLPPDKLRIQVSLDGASARAHDFVRGAGSHALTMTGIRLLVAAGFASRIQVTFTEMAHNFDELPQLLELLVNLGIGRLISATLVKGGRAAASAHMRQPSPAQYRALIHAYQSDAAFKMRCDQHASIAAIQWFKHRLEHTDSHCSCLKNLFVDAGGRIFPCTMLLLERFASESVYDRPMDQVIQDALAIWAELPILHRKRQKALASCNGCPGKNHCGGGCMGRAAAARGELMDPEDRCLLRRAVYGWDEPPDPVKDRQVLRKRLLERENPLRR